MGRLLFSAVLFYFLATAFLFRVQAQNGQPTTKSQINLFDNFSATSLDSGIVKILNSSWAVRNSGETQLFDISLTQAHRLQARKGEDLNLKKVVNKLNRKIRVAVLDTGVDVLHPGLQGKIVRNEGECKRLAEYQACLKDSSKPANQCSTDFLDARTALNDTNSNQYPMDCTGWNVLSQATANNVLGTPVIEDEIGHGTHVASLVVQVSPNAQIIPVQVLGREFAPNRPVRPFSITIPGQPGSNEPIDLSPGEDVRNGYDLMSGGELAQIVARGLIYAIEAKADIINLSIGWPQLQDHRILREAIALAQKNGAIVIAAAGNDSTSALLRPCQYDGVICVGATRPDGSMASFSNFGYGVDVAAPGVAIAGLIPSISRSIGIPGYFGVDLMSGTSQAAPLVAGVVAEMLASGIPKSEIYARLVLGARPLQTELPVLVGPVHLPGNEVMATSPYLKTVLGGQVDLQKALAIPSQPLILAANKQTQVIEWDLKSKILKASFPLKNHFGDLESDANLKVSLIKSASVMPVIKSAVVRNENGLSFSDWESQSEKYLDVEFAIVDSADVSKSRIPRELELNVAVQIGGKAQKSFPLRAEIVVNLALETLAAHMDVQSIPLSRTKTREEKFLLIDEVYDQNLSQRDYLLLGKGETDFSVAIAKMTETGYQVSKPIRRKIEGNLRPTLPLHRIRLDIDFDGVSEYVFSLQEFLDQDEFRPGSNNYALHLFVLNNDLSLRQYTRFDDLRVLMPSDLSWVKVGNELRPSWVAQGFRVANPTGIDTWFGDDDFGKPKEDLVDEDIYFYYLNEKYELKNIKPPQGYRIVDVLQAGLKEIRQGLVPVLVARNHGTPNKPSYLNDFYSGWIQNEKLSGLNLIKDPSTATELARNLIDTRKDRSLNLSTEDSEFKGNFWFGLDAHMRQRVTLIDFSSMTFVDQLLDSKQQVFDAPLRIRSAYTGTGQVGTQKNVTRSAAFMMTNTEIQYHDLTRNEVASTSLNKYTFVGDTLTVDLQFPLTLSSHTKGALKTPALFTTEGSRLSTSMRVLAADYDAKTGKLVGLVSPARLSLQSPLGCRPLDFPLYIDQEYAIDFDCGNRIVRMKLRY